MAVIGRDAAAIGYHTMRTASLVCAWNRGMEFAFVDSTNLDNTCGPLYNIFCLLKCARKTTMDINAACELSQSQMNSRVFGHIFSDAVSLLCDQRFCVCQREPNQQTNCVGSLMYVDNPRASVLRQCRCVEGQRCDVSYQSLFDPLKGNLSNTLFARTYINKLGAGILPFCGTKNLWSQCCIEETCAFMRMLTDLTIARCHLTIIDWAVAAALFDKIVLMTRRARTQSELRDTYIGVVSIVLKLYVEESTDFTLADVFNISNDELRTLELNVISGLGCNMLVSVDVMMEYLCIMISTNEVVDQAQISS